MSPAEQLRLRVLHGVRVLGYAPTSRVAERTTLPATDVEDELLDAQAAGQVTWSRFADDGGWSLTEAGKAAGEQLLAHELDSRGARALAEAVMAEFEGLNQQIAGACTRWQLTELGMAEPPATLTEVLAELSDGGAGWAGLEDRLTPLLPRFNGYHARFSTALDRARADPAWVAGTDRESAHRVWFELHEDLLATLGRQR